MLADAIILNGIDKDATFTDFRKELAKLINKYEINSHL